MVGVMFWFSWLLSVRSGGLPSGDAANYPDDVSAKLWLMQEHMETVTSLCRNFRVRIKAYWKAEKTRSATAFDGLYNRLVHRWPDGPDDPILEVLGGFAVAGVIGVAAWQVANGWLQVGDVAGFITALLMPVQPVRAIGTLTRSPKKVWRPPAACLRCWIKSPYPDPASPKTLAQIKGEIAFNDISFAYQDAAILTEIAFTVASGQTVALVGPSGSGKSTIINLLPRFYDPAAGQITIDGTPISHLSLPVCAAISRWCLRKPLSMTRPRRISAWPERRNR